jgi:hypothetical protein
MRVDGIVAAAGVAVAGAVILGRLKLESVRMSRSVAGRAGMGEGQRWQFWRRLRLPGVTLSVAALVLPFIFLGELSPGVSSELVFEAAGSGWRERVVDGHGGGAAAGSAMPSVWISPQGFEVSVAATTLPPFTAFASYCESVASGGDGERLRIGGHEVLQRVVGDAGSSATIELHVLDPSGGDVHVLATTTPRAQMATRLAALRDLVDRSYFVSGS